MRFHLFIVLVQLLATGCVSDGDDPAQVDRLLIPDIGADAAPPDAMADEAVVDMAPVAIEDASVDALPADMPPAPPDMAPPPPDYCAIWQAVAGRDLPGELHAELVRSYEPLRLVNELPRYTIARRWMFLNVERRDLATRQGRGVQTLYTGMEFETQADRTPDANVINTEHVTPRAALDPDRQSRRYDHQQSDLHNLYPTVPDVNMARGSLPFGDVEQVSDRFGAARLGRDASGRRVFEPRAERQGDVARALMYMATRWGLEMDARELETARAWHAGDPVDEWERARNEAVARVQGTRNPFVDCPALVDRVEGFGSFAPIEEQLP